MLDLVAMVAIHARIDNPTGGESRHRTGVRAARGQGGGSGAEPEGTFLEIDSNVE